MSLTAAKPIAGRSLGWTPEALAHWPYAKFWRPQLAPLAAPVGDALARGPVAPPLLPELAPALARMVAGETMLERGYALQPSGALHVAIDTPMPGVTPAMIDWWFGWHGSQPERYKLWHPQAHVHVGWLAPPPAGSRGRARYLGHTSIVDEYVGSELGRYAIRFVAPRELGVDDAAIESGADTLVCARVGLADLPLDAGYLVHHVRRCGAGSEMRSRFWLGGPHVAARGRRLAGALLVGPARVLARPSEAQARALLVHCAQEMAHLAAFLPDLHAECHALE